MELYNGNISAMKWKAGNETTERGYKFTYDNLSRLTNSNYGEGVSIASNLNRFNEKLSYDKMGNIMTLQRGGKITSSTYNLIDNLTYTYTGNRLTKVTDAVTTTITNESTLHFVDGANVDNEYDYDINGNLIKDLNKNITSITYNYLNLPNIITFADGNTITYDYDANGSKLSVAYKIGGNIAKTEYVGNKIYKNGTLSMILTEEGYITMNGTTPTYHYFQKDHQGNNRVVINQSGTVEQVNHCYPFGGLFGEGLQDSNQSYKYNGKEFDNLLGLNVYDYGARHYDPYGGRWIAVDPLAEKYPSWSPYVFVMNNPINLIDPDGREPIKPLVGTAAMFRTLLDNSPRKVGGYTGSQASNYLKSLGNTEFSWKQMRPLPTETGYFNQKEGRYIYTEKGGWVDMTHFMFYAGKAYQYKLDGNENPIGEAVQDGYKQELSDKYAAKHSAYSYEDLPSDKLGAEFAVNHFDPNSKQTFGEQLENYLNNVLKATDPQNAPNYDKLPTTEPNKPSRTNTTTTPVYTKENK